MEWSFSRLLICYSNRNASFLSIWYILIILALLPLSSSFLEQSTLLPFLQITLPYLTFFCLTSTTTANITPKTVILLNSSVSNLIINYTESISKQEVNEFQKKKRSKDHINIAKYSVFPCLDYLELNYFNLTKPLDHFNHLIRVYHSNSSIRNSSSNFLTNSSIDDQNELIYLKEFTINLTLQNSKYLIYCNQFDPIYLYYCFRYVSINQINGQVRYESNLNCLPTLANFKENEFRNEQQNEQQNTESKKTKLNFNFNLNYSNNRYGPSLKLFKEEDKKLFNLNKSNHHTHQQTKHIKCSCGRRNYLNFNQTNYLIQLTSGNGYCNAGSSQSNHHHKIIEDTTKKLIKIRKLNFEFCFIDFNLPTWIEIKVKDVLLLAKKDDDLKQFSFNNLIIRDGHDIAPQLNYFHSFPAFHFISTGLLRFESKTLGNQYTIELNQLSEQPISVLNKKPHNLHKQLRVFNEDKIAKTDKFKNERMIKLNNTEKNLRNLLAKNEIKNGVKHKLNQAFNLKHINRLPYEEDLKNENLFILLIDENGQNLLVDNQNKLNANLNRFNRTNFDSKLKQAESYGNALILHLIAFLLFLLITISISIFIFILSKTKIKPPTGNLIRFGLSNENYLQSNNDYQEVQSNNNSSKYNLKSKLIKIDEETIYESCKMRSDEETSDQSDSQDDLLELDLESVENELSNLSKNQSSEEFSSSNTVTLKNETNQLKSNQFKSSFKDDFHELNKKRKMFKNCFNSTKDEDTSNTAIGRLSQCSFPTSEISLELDYYDYLTPFVPKLNL